MTGPSVPAAPYIDWGYYNGTYGGTAVPQAALSPQLTLLATRWIDRLTFGRAAPVIATGTDTDTVAAIKFACCSVAEELYRQLLTAQEDGVQSESQGEYSVTYTKNALNSKSSQTKLTRAARIWLEDTLLMFPGFEQGEYGGWSGGEWV